MSKREDSKESKSAASGPARRRRTGAHPAMLEPERLLKKCEITFGRASGPGGQHRNKVETAVSITHEPTGVSATASERRHQAQNRHQAIFRLRLHLARKVRRKIDRDRYRPSELWQSRRQGRQMSVNPQHRDYPGLLAEAMDVVTARDGDVAGAAGVLGVSMSQLAKLIRHDRPSFGMINQLREERGLKPLK